MTFRIKTLGSFFSIALFIIALAVAAVAVTVIDSVTTVRSSWTLFNTAFTKQVNLSALQGAIGYGGMIHGFKNYVLRQDGSCIKDIEQTIADAQKAIASIRAAGVNGTEEAALNTITAVVANYAERLTIRPRDGGQGRERAGCRHGGQGR